MDCKISLIIPMYNVEKYIGRCLYSCITQDLPLTEYEIIVINDGSSDNSLIEAQKIKNQCSNIKIVTQNNSGLSAARNKGLSLASGKYIWFIDSDDWIAENCLKRIYDILEAGNLDVLRIGWHLIDFKGKVHHELLSKRSNDIFSGIDYVNNVLGTVLYACSFIYKNKFLKKRDFQFVEGMLYEDVEFNTKVLIEANRIQTISDVCYNYFIRDNSISKRVDEKALNDVCKLIIILQERKRSLQICSGYFNRLINDFICWGLILLSTGEKCLQKRYLHFLMENHITHIKIGKSKKNFITTILFNINPNMCLFILKYFKYFYKKIKYNI